MGGRDQPSDGRTSSKAKKPKNEIKFKTNRVDCSTRTYHVPTPGATVWATWYNFLGTFKEDPGSGWSHLIGHLNSVEALADGLEKAGLRNKVSHLALVGHNEANWHGVRATGTVTFNPPIPGGQPRPEVGLRPSYVPPQPTPVEAFANLAPYLLPDAWLSLYICKSAAGPEGDALLTAVSKVLAGRTIVGFVCYVVVGSTGGFAKPGNATGTTFGEDGRSDPELVPLTPWGKAAKRAQNGLVVHTPWLEKKGTVRRVTHADGTHSIEEGPPYRCANQCCPGTHSSRDHDCFGW